MLKVIAQDFIKPECVAEVLPLYRESPFRSWARHFLNKDGETRSFPVRENGTERHRPWSEEINGGRLLMADGEALADGSNCLLRRAVCST